MLTKDFEILDHFLTELRGDMADWTRYVDTETRKIYWKQENGLKSITVFMEAIYDAPLINLVSILGEIQFFKEWVPMCRQSDLLGEVSYLRKLGYFRFFLPWPFSDR